MIKGLWVGDRSHWFSNSNFVEDDVFVGPLGDGHYIPPVEGLDVVVGGSKDDLEVLCGL